MLGHFNCLEIPDEYALIHPELVDLLSQGAMPHLPDPGASQSAACDLPDDCGPATPAVNELRRYHVESATSGK
jgi:hypothetical protein